MIFEKGCRISIFSKIQENFLNHNKSHHFVDLDELIRKIYTVLGFEENWKQFCVEINYF